MTTLSIDVGGTRIKAALVSAEVGPVTVVDTPRTAADALGAIVALAQGREFERMGVCVPGLVDDTGRVVALPGKLDGIVGRDLPGEIERAVGVRPVVVNDAIAYGVGEASAGAGRSYDRVVVMTIGTGVGVAVLEGGRPLGGGPLGGGLMGGQIPIGDGDPRRLDTSGRAGTIEACCRADRIADYAGAATVPAALAGYAAGDPAAVAGIETYRAWLVRAIRALANAHGAAAVVVGGGPLTADGPLLDGVEDAVRATLWPGHALDVHRAVLGDAAALHGLASLAVDIRAAPP